MSTDSRDSSIIARNLVKKYGSVIALDGLNLEVRAGTVLGLLGPNGAGKSTALKLIAGVTQPTKGKVQIEGKVAPLIELGAGFHHELSFQFRSHLCPSS